MHFSGEQFRCCALSGRSARLYADEHLEAMHFLETGLGVVLCLALQQQNINGACFFLPT
jgi:hypothetical protein